MHWIRDSERLGKFYLWLKVIMNFLFLRESLGTFSFLICVQEYLRECKGRTTALLWVSSLESKDLYRDNETSGTKGTLRLLWMTYWYKKVRYRITMDWRD